MTSPMFQLAYGMTYGVYFTLFCMVILFAMSYAGKRYNWRIAAAFTLVAIAIAGFGLFNIFYQNIHSSTPFSATFIKLCALLTPTAMAILVYIYIRASSLRLLGVYDFVKRFGWLERISYFIVALATLAIALSQDKRVILQFVALGFVPTTMFAASLSFFSAKRYVLGHVIGVMFTLVALACMYLLYKAGDLRMVLDVHMTFVAHAFFAFLLIGFCFSVIRYGHEDIAAFFNIHDLNQFNMLSNLNAALSEDQFYFVFQPQRHLHDNSITGVEALIRWKHPRHGTISPQYFIPLAEATGMIDNIAQWLIRHAIEAGAQLLTQGLPLRLSINLSPANLNTNIVAFLANELKQNQLPASHIMIEMTEGQMLQTESTDVQKSLKHLHELGVGLSIDDYGTGFSSLSYLKKLDINELKIDRSFIEDLTANSQNFAIVSSTLDMANSLGLATVAEGVEDEKTCLILKQLGCESVQGYGVAKPMHYDELLNWLAKQPTPSSKPTTSAPTTLESTAKTPHTDVNHL